MPQARVYKVWNVPGWGTADGDDLVLLGNLLSSGKSSRLYKRLVYDEQIATSVSAFPDLREIGGLFVIQATAKPGGDIARSSGPSTRKSPASCERVPRRPSFSG